MNKDEITKIVLALRNSGLTSCAKIADRLNADGISTVSGKGKWERKMVLRILDKAADPKPADQSPVKIADKQKDEKLLHIATQKNIELESALCNATQKVTQVDLLKAELDDIKADNTALNSLINRHMIDNQNFRADVDRLESENKIFRAKIDSLTRSLVETESKYKTLYESQLKELGNKLASANDELEKVKHNQKLIELETSRQTNLDGWTINRRSDGKINMIRRISGRNITVYVGNEFDADIARRKIKAKLDQLNQDSAPAKPSQPAAVPAATQLSCL